MNVRVAAIDWQRVGTELDEHGYATVGQVLTAPECAELVALYPERARFRSRIEMERLRFGIGEYKYFARPLPAIVQDLRVAIYRRLAPIANRWAERLEGKSPYPPSLASFLRICHAHGQTKPTPLLLRYAAGGYNCLHQDIYGDVAFPLQFTCLLSAPGTDYTGGEFVLVEQRPRAQSRGEAIALGQGEGIVFPNCYRPVAGTHGDYRATVRHGVSTVRSGVRYALGIIFHDAK
jgi:hypothetical protein